MFQSFTGSSKRPRQVNLSGRVANPFAAVGQGPPSALASAQQERAQRQKEREKLNAVKLLQRVWRGHVSRQRTCGQIRQEWDAVETSGISNTTSPDSPYASEAQAFLQLQRLLLFLSLRNESDRERLRHYCKRQTRATYTGGSWPMSYIRLQKAVLGALELQIKAINGTARPDNASQSLMPSLETLDFLTEQIPKEVAQNSRKYYEVMAAITHHQFSLIFGPLTTDFTDHEKNALLNTTVAPLKKFHTETLQAYEAFACVYLTLPEFCSRDAYSFSGTSGKTWLDNLAESINHKLLAHAVAELFKRPDLGGYQLSIEDRIHLLGCFIYCHRHAYNFQNAHEYASHRDFVAVVSNLLSSIADEVSIDVQPMGDVEDDSGYAKTTSRRIVLSPFVQEQVASLVDENSIRGLLTGRSPDSTDEDARELASYALTLIRFFPRRGDEIRMWLYLGSGSERSTPAIRYLWQAARATNVVQQIARDARAAVKLLKPPETRLAVHGYQAPGIVDEEAVKNTRNEWRVILIFLELYIFVLKVMDDEEFFYGANPMAAASSARSSKTRENALPLEEVKDLTVFLKNLGFTMYFSASEIQGDNQRNDSGGSISSLFNVSTNTVTMLESTDAESRPAPSAIGGVPGMSLDYVKGLITGLLRMLYERDSRRKFLPADHWLMTSRFDMDSFITAVVQEEEKRNRLQEEDDEEAYPDVEQDIDGLEFAEPRSLIGTRRTQQARHLERLQWQQRKASRRRYLQLVAPRLEILQNMPFFIPFTTRVQIFREFVKLDQMKRRRGHVDPDQWRMATMHDFHRSDPIERHHAKVRRKHEFEDAFMQFFKLGEGLKEPIQITFVDQFGGIEAGIDGGGVTKEFLTSVTSQAFSPADNGLDLFVENDAHLLYPNPSAVEAKKEELRLAGIREGSALHRSDILELLERYEFLGRIVGKCLYEGILVDINFAPFFLLKWALTGGTNSASKESGYRANLNDLRDLDESLYQGLLQLKNYPGNVEEDLSLFFTVTDVIRTDPVTGATKTVTKELTPNGSNLPVTNENRLVYISYIARHRLQIQPHLQTTAFLRGLSTMIQPSWLSMFNQSELQTLIGGTSSSINVADLRRNTQYGGVYVIGDDGLEHPSVQLFWHVMENLSDDEKRAVLKFVTSTPRAPLLGFASLNPRFSIRDAGSDESRLPSTSTCVNLLKLPLYKDENVLKEKLLYAVNSGAGFDLS
ncbi:hypothetical protein K490DRAFT_36855 [Saccharata proteae CBS 121410]|uniref:HECT-type E3 ubiquitin transferase n=1 Tax=Saccharata proteae CBS 121410 TaxID=1314787 RepID=A0A6A5YEU0_9PEZI|nr:hypothetical protein K490DRAFT_36855 [Saccharata proteae CBS 121410]